MKKILFNVVFASLTAVTFSQQISSSATIDKTDYLQKSKHQKTTAWILLGGGAVLIGGSLISAISEVAKSKYFFDANTTGSTILFFTGIAAAGSSIPFFISSGRNKGRAMSLSLKEETIPAVTGRSFVNRSYPAASVKINF
jgi:hypothetical protein